MDHENHILHYYKSELTGIVNSVNNPYNDLVKHKCNAKSWRQVEEWDDDELLLGKQTICFPYHSQQICNIVILGLSHIFLLGCTGCLKGSTCTA